MAVGIFQIPDDLLGKGNFQKIYNAAQVALRNRILSCLRFVPCYTSAVFFSLGRCNFWKKYSRREAV